MSALSLRSDRAWMEFGRYVATSLCAGQSLRSDLDLSPMFRERVFSARFFVKINLFEDLFFVKMFMLIFMDI